jgi:hypothetical protein
MTPNAVGRKNCQYLVCADENLVRRLTKKWMRKYNEKIER